MGRTVV
jgi:hypothetical protein